MFPTPRNTFWSNSSALILARFPQILAVNSSSPASSGSAPNRFSSSLSRSPARYAILPNRRGSLYLSSRPSSSSATTCVCFACGSPAGCGVSIPVIPRCTSSADSPSATTASCFSVSRISRNLPYRTTSRIARPGSSFSISSGLSMKSVFPSVTLRIRRPAISRCRPRATVSTSGSSGIVPSIAHAFTLNFSILFRRTVRIRDTFRSLEVPVLSSRSRSLLLLAIVFTLSSPVLARKDTGFLDRTLTLHGATYKYQVFVPDNWSSNQKWPIVLFLHGAGERGADGLIQTEVGIATAIRRDRSRFPALVVLPQCLKDHDWDKPDMEELALAALAA